MRPKKPKKRMDRRRALNHILSLSNDPDFVIGAKEVLDRVSQTQLSHIGF